VNWLLAWSKRLKSGSEIRIYSLNRNVYTEYFLYAAREHILYETHDALNIAR
jgi:hypothetical protein